MRDFRRRTARPEAAQEAPRTATPIASWHRFERRWWTWLTNPWKSLYPWGLGMTTKGGAIIWVSTARQTDAQHAHHMLKQQFDPAVEAPTQQGHNLRRPYHSGRKAKI